jgi:hypothetical protein
LITISGKLLPPPPRKVIVERLPPVPSHPPAIILERWLPYPKVKRRVIYQKAAPKPECVYPKPRNVIIEWEEPEIEIEREFKHLGVSEVDPEEYKKRHGQALIDTRQLPEFLRNIQPPNSIKQAATTPPPPASTSYDSVSNTPSSISSSPISSPTSHYNDDSVPSLEGDIEALALIDLDEYGLGEYKYELERRGIHIPKNRQYNSSKQHHYQQQQHHQQQQQQQSNHQYNHSQYYHHHQQQQPQHNNCY